MHRVAMNERAAPPDARGVAFGQRPHDRVEDAALEIAVGPCPPEKVEKLGLLPVLSRDLGDNLLGEHVERLFWDRQPVELAPPHAVDEGDALEAIVERQRKEPPLRRAVDRMAGTADPLQEGRDRARRADLADELDVADVDAELERGGRDHRPQRARFQLLFGRKPPLLGEAAVMRRDRVVAEPLAKLTRHALAHAARVDEDERGAMGANEVREPVVDLGPDLVRHDGCKGRVRRLDRKVAGALVAGIDNRDLGRRSAARIGAREKAGDRVDRILRRGKPDPLQSAARERRQPFERQREMGAALVRRDRVDLVEDQCARRLQRVAAGFGAEQHIERLGRGDEDVRGLAPHPGALGRAGVAGAHKRADGDVRSAHPFELAPDALERRLEIAMDVVRQRLQGGHVDDLGLVGQRALDPLPDEVVDRRQEGGERLARAGRRGDQGVPPRLDRRPRAGLRRTRGGEGAGEPCRNGWMKEPIAGRRAAPAGGTRMAQRGRRNACVDQARRSQIRFLSFGPAQAPAGSLVAKRQSLDHMAIRGEFGRPRLSLLPACGETEKEIPTPAPSDRPPPVPPCS